MSQIKLIFLRLYLLAACLFYNSVINAYDFQVDGLYYEIIAGTNEVFIHPANGKIQMKYSGNITIPEKVTDYNGNVYTVVGIGEYAFASSSISSIQIPNTIRFIDQFAFSGCYQLKTLQLPNSLERIGGNFIRGSAVTKISIPSSVTKIEKEAFAGTSLLSIDLTSLSSSITEIAEGLFYGTSLTSISIPNSIKSIGKQAFSQCTKLTSVFLPNYIIKIEDQAFYNCSSLENINLPDQISSIGNSAFWACSSLKSIKLPNSLSKIEDYVFLGCGLTSIEIPQSVTSIGKSSFDGCENLNEIKLSNSLISIGENAFGSCLSLTKIILPASLTSIGRNAFHIYLKEVHSKIQNPFETYAFSSSSGHHDRVLYIPSGTKEKYLNCYGWGNFFKEIIEETESYTLSITATGSGSATYNGTSVRGKTTSFTVNEGTSATITFTPDNGYRIKSVKVNNFTVSVSNNQYTISSINANTTVSVEFEAVPVTTYTLSITASGNGSASYSGSTIRSKTSSFSVNAGSSATIRFLPDNGYRSKSVKVNNSTVSASNNQYTISSIYANTSVSVEFEAIPPTTYTLTITARGGGYASYNGETIRYNTSTYVLNQGVSAKITFTPDNGYRIKSVKVNGSTVSVSNNQYTVSNITKNTTVEVAFEEIPVTTYTLSVTASGNGSVSYGSTSIRSKTSSFTVNEGTSATITFSPDNGYRIKSVKVNNSTVSVSNNQYTISNINANTTISVEFEAIPVTTYTLSIRVSGNGSASYNGTTIRSKTSSFTVNQGSSVTITFSSDNEYQIQSVKVNGSTVTVSNNQYTISNISQNTSVEVEFTNMPTTGKFEVDGLCYNILSNNTVELTWRGINNPYVGDVVVPENVSYNGNIYRIVKIGEYAFVRITDMSGGAVGWGKSDGLTSVKLPSTLLTIGSHAFSGCISLTSLTIPTSVTSIESWACDGCIGLSSITIPNSVMNIGICAFYRCESLSSILIPSSVTNIGYSVFDECRNLASIVVEGGNMQYDSRNNCNAIIETSANQLIAGCKNTTIPSSVTRIGYAAFCRCIGLTSITIPSSVVSIGGAAFYGCIGLSSITIPSSVTTIESGAFYGCLGFTSITIPNSVSSLGSAAFSGCNNLESVISYIETPFNIDRVFEKISASAILQVPKGTKSGYQALSGWADYFNEIVELNSNFEVDGLCYNILSDNQVEVTYKNENGNSYSGTLVIPEKVQYGGKEYIVSSIGDHAFYKCENITGSLTIPNSVTSIGNYAFWGCSGFTGLLTIPNSVTSIGNSAFSGCSGFTGTLTIPNSVTSIGKSAFSMCSGFTGSLTIPNSVTSIGESAFYECRGFTGSLTIPNTVSSIGLNTFRSCGFTGSLVIPNSVTSIGDYAFYGCSGLTGSLTIPNTVSFIGKYTFSNCGFTGSLFIPSSVTSIRESAFSLCTGFTGSLSIPSSVTSIGNSAFLGCRGLTSLIIPESVTSIGYSAFEYCKKLILVKSQIDQPFSIDDRVFQEISSVAELKVPKGTISKYQALSGWTKHFKKIVEFSDSPTFYSLTIEVSGNGFASYDGTVVQGKTTSFTMNEGSSATITFTPNDGYQIKDVKVNGSIVSVSNSQYTISGIYKDITVEVEFEEILQAFSVDNVNYTVVSVGEQTIRLTKGNYNMLIEVPAIVSYQDAEWTVTGIDNGALANNSDLAAIIWHPEAAFTEQVSNPNLLLYVDKAEYAPSAIKNVVVNGSASSITLTDAANGNDFYCPQEFTAQRISYTHNYSMKTGIGKAQGWETIALPFDVQKVTHQSKGEIVSFAKWKSGDAKKPFWLMELSSSGWKMAESIKANTPYIISMPNNEEYKSGFLLNGSVTFSAENVNVVKTENLSVANYSDRTFVPTFASLEKSNDVLALNVVNDIERVTGGSIEGSTFERNLRPIHPFEAYMTSTSSTRSIGIDEGMATGIDDLMFTVDGLQFTDDYSEEYYDLQGRRVNQPGKGVYIYKGKKVIR